MVQLANSSGIVTKVYQYDAFGVEKDKDASDDNPFRYCGEYYDKETGTIYLRARYYNPSTGRFISQDSVAGKAKDPLSLNLFTYGHNNPVRFIDPSGHTAKEKRQAYDRTLVNMRGSGLRSGDVGVVKSFSGGMGNIGAYSKKGAGTPAITNDWLRLYSNPTVSSPGRNVAKHPDANNYDWGMPEELKGHVNDNQLTANSRTITGKTPIKTSNNLYTDADGRYWIAVGPNVMNPSHKLTSVVTANEMNYGTKVDIHVQDKNGVKYYIPAVVGDVKNHSYPDGLYQTGTEFGSQTAAQGHGDGSTIEFLGYEILNNTGIYDTSGANSSVNITNNYKIIEIIVYDGITNY